jgi:GNAT superfamily N-acetyltransferase
VSELPDETRLLAVMDRTWAPAAITSLGPWKLRQGNGGGKRVSAATSDSPVTKADIDLAEAEMRALGQAELFMLRNSADPLDRQLATRGYRIVDPVLMFAAPVEAIAEIETVPLNAIPSDEPLAMMEELWKASGFDAARVNVMRRTLGPKTYLFSRYRDSPAGCAFVAIDENIAMLHALAVTPEFRRDGVARRIMGRAAIWAKQHGARYLSVVTTGENLPARGLFSGIGMQVVGKYHYRMK